jgi:hypothetical protein
MTIERTDVRDPGLAFGLSLLFPGLGHLYAGKFVNFLTFAAAEFFLFTRDLWLPLAGLHLFQAIAAAGAAKQHNAQRAAAAVLDIPPPPPPGQRRTSPAEAEPPPVPVRPARGPAPPPPPPATLPPLTADAFLEDLQEAWRDHRAGTLTARQFADRKWSAIGRVAVEDRDDADALVAAAEELGRAGVLTSEEVGRLVARVAP